MTTIYLIRHAEAEGNLYSRSHGWYNALITENGFRQIEALAKRFADIHVDAVWSSDLYRTMTTARAIYVPKGLELHTDPDLREINMGDWEDQTWAEMRYRDPKGFDQFQKCDPAWHAPNGEGFDDVASRTEKAIRRIAQAYPNQTVAIFCHGTAIRQSMSSIKGIPPQERGALPANPNTAVNCLTYEDGQFQVVFERDASHLDPSITMMAQKGWRLKGISPQEAEMRFRPIDWQAEKDLYLAFRREAWTSTHVNGPEFLAEDFLQDAEEHLSRSPWGVTAAISGDRIVGMLQLDTQRYSQDGAGYIPFCYLVPDKRGLDMGVQLIGQAVSFFRPLGRDKLRLRCAPYNKGAQHFYGKHGFVKIGEEQGSRVPLDILEKYIGYDR